MMQREIEKLRQSWQALGDPPCDHLTLELMTSETGYFTGVYVCTRCGCEVVQKPTS